MFSGAGGDQSSPFISFFSHRAVGKVKFNTASSGSVPRLSGETKLTLSAGEDRRQARIIIYLYFFDKLPT